MNLFIYKVIVLLFLIVYNNATTVPENLKDFKQWMDKESIYINPSIDIVDLELYGRSIVANRLIKEGEVLIKVPTDVMLSRSGIEKHIPQYIQNIIVENEIGGTDALAIYLMYSLINKNSYFNSYVSILPKEFSTSLYFDEDEMNELQRSKLKYFTQSRLDGIKKHYDVIFKQLSVNDKEFKKQEYSFKLFKWALSCIWSRAFSLSSEEGAMVPLADMFNAVGRKEISKVKPDSKKDVLTYYASKNIEQGEQIFTPYGVYKSIGSAQMLMDYGLVFEEGSDGDMVHFSIDGFARDENYIDEKIDLLTKLDVSKDFILHKGKLPQDLLLFARIKNLKGNELSLALNHYEQVEDKYQPLNRRNERVALRYASNLLSRFLDSYDSSLADDIDLLDRHKEGKVQLSYNLINIIRVRKSEKEILKHLIESFDLIRENLQQ